MSKREEQQMARLLKKTAGKAVPPKGDDQRAAQYDSTLRQKPAEPDEEAKRFFKDMKRREF
jgi:hypothetical protein